MSDVHRGLTKRSIAGVLWTGLSVGAESLLQAIALMVLARLLAPDEFGLFAATMVIVGLSTIFSGLGVAPAIVQRPELEQRHVRVGFTLSVMFSLIVAGLVWAGAPALAALFRLPELTPVVQGTSLVFICQGFAMVAYALAQRALRFRWLAAVHAGAFTAGFVVAGPLLAWLGFGVWALIGALLIYSLLRMILLQAGQPHSMRPQLDPRTIGELLYFGGGFTLARIGNYLASQADKVVVGRWLGAQTLGVYVLVYQLVAAPAILVGQVLDRVLFPTMALVQLEPARLARAYRSAVSICAVLTLPMSIVVALLAPEIIEVLLGGQWSGAVVPLQILALGILFRTSYKLSDSVARATGAVYARAWRQGLYAAAIAAMAFIGQILGSARRRRWGGRRRRLQFPLDGAPQSPIDGSELADFWSCPRPGIAAGGRDRSPDLAARELAARDADRSDPCSRRFSIDSFRRSLAALATVPRSLSRVRCAIAATCDRCNDTGPIPNPHALAG